MRIGDSEVVRVAMEMNIELLKKIEEGRRKCAAIDRLENDI